MIFYNHPSTTNATAFFRTIPVLPEASGRVAEVYVGFTGPVTKGAPIFRLDSSKQQAALETARLKVAEVDASMSTAEVDVVKAEAQIQEARSNLQQAQDELAVAELQDITRMGQSRISTHLGLLGDAGLVLLVQPSGQDAAAAAGQPERVAAGAGAQFVGEHLQPHQALHPAEQRHVADRLGQKIIRARGFSCSPGSCRSPCSLRFPR